MSSPKIIAITSGKGGVGKTSLTVNLGIALSQQQQRVCLFDADTNLANINIMLRLSPAYTLEQVIRGDRSIQDILLHKVGMDIVPGASGISDFVHLAETGQQHLLQAIEQLEQTYDYLLVDTSAGISENVLGFVEAAHQALVVISQEPTSLTDAFSLLRVLKNRGYRKTINLVVNSAQTELDARKVFNRFASAVAKYLGYRVRYLGYILRDNSMSDAITRQNPILLHNPASPASISFMRLADSLQRLTDNMPEESRLSDMLKQRVSSSELPSFSLSGRVAKPASGDAGKPPSMEHYRTQMKALIRDSQVSRESLDGLFADLLQEYEARFKACPFNPIDALNHDLELNRIPQNRLNELLMTLQLFYQGHMSENDKDSYGQYLRQLINGYVDQFKSFPFDAVYTLYQYLDLEIVPEQQIRKLLMTLHLIYQDKYLSCGAGDEDARRLLYCAEHNPEDMDRMISHLQEKHLHNLRKKIEQNPQAQEVSEGVKTGKDSEARSILDSIRYASLTDE